METITSLIRTFCKETRPKDGLPFGNILHIAWDEEKKEFIVCDENKIIIQHKDLAVAILSLLSVASQQKRTRI